MLVLLSIIFLAGLIAYLAFPAIIRIAAAPFLPFTKAYQEKINNPQLSKLLIILWLAVLLFVVLIAIFSILS